MVALKVFNKGREREMKREIAALAQLPEECPFVPHLIDSTETAIVMTLLKGRPATEMLTESRRDIDLVQRIGFGIVQGLYAMGQENMVHQDLKPENIIVNPEWVGTIADFGCAGILSPDKSISPSGTPGYAAPERFGRSSSGVSPADDMWSLGATLFELATGERLLRAESDFESAERSSWEPRFVDAIPLIQKELSSDSDEAEEQKKIISLQGLIRGLLNPRSTRFDINVVRQHSFFRSLMIVQVIRPLPVECKIGSGEDPQKMGMSPLSREGVAVIERAPFLKVVEYRHPHDVEAPLKRPRDPYKGPLEEVSSIYRIPESVKPTIKIYSRLSVLDKK